jgi:D-sedoheptulose 7-phosphate isomerase
MDHILQSLQEARQILDDFLNDQNNIAAINRAAGLFADSLRSGGKILSIGNGGSMSDAMHFAEELTGRFRDDRPALPAISIADPTHLTCTANDYGFEAIFSRYIEALGKKEDVLLAISTSGNSENIIRAMESAAGKGMKIVALTGKDGGRAAELADCEIRVPWHGYSDRIQEMHIKIIHILIRAIEISLFE